MQTLADLSFEFIWHLLFDGEDIVELDYCVTWQECLPDFFEKMSKEEKMALSISAQKTRDRLLAEPDEYGYTPRSKVTDEQKIFLESMASGEIFRQFE